MLRFAGWFALFLIIAYICGLMTSVPVVQFARNNVFSTFSVVDGDNARAELERQFGITFPNSFTEFHRANRGDQAYWLQFRLPPNTLSGVFRNSAFMTCSFPLQDNYRPTFDFDRILGADEWVRMSWWNPGGTRVYIGGECTGSDYRIFRMFTDISNSAQWIFYMEIVQT